MKLGADLKCKKPKATSFAEAPIHWKAKRLKFVLKQPLQYGANESAEDDDRELPRYVRITDVDERGNLRDETFRSLPHEIAKDYLLKEGDILFARSGATAGKTFLYSNSWGECAYAGYLIRARIDYQKANPRFLRYFTDSAAYWGWISANFIQATIQNVSADKYANLSLAFPPVDEQQAIADFLDRETARLDRLVGKKRELIEELKEKRTALISRTVTRGLPAEAAAKVGLNPQPKLKSSGIEWLGDIPEHWEIKRLRFVSRIQTGSTPPKSDDDNYSDEGVLWVKPDDLSEFKPIIQTKQRLSDAGIALARPIPSASPLVCCIGTVGKFGYSLDPVTTNQQINAVVYKNQTVLSRFGLYVIAAAESEHVRRANVNVVPILNTTQQRNISMPVPNLREQCAIVDYLDRETAKIDKMMEKVEAAIEKLQEYRTALITAAVTGKIDVRAVRK